MHDKPMSRERLEKVKETALAALEYSGQARYAYLERACDGDEALLDSVKSLLEVDTGPAAFLESHVAAAPARLHQHIGPYEIIREIGHGGMGSIYLGRREDGLYQQEVAIKVLKTGLASEHLIQRFWEERQILAHLNHPNIARLYDGGTTEEHLPYLVMEYVEGDPIHHYCQKHALAIQDRLRLFRQVCEAVRYAHQNLVVHRDIKPGNILVTATGEPRLLDFGIAKMIDPLHGANPAETATHQRVMTPEYASPEQVLGQPITTATDIYSLGVLLYFLLTGKRPYDLQDLSPLDMQKQICEQEPHKPSDMLKSAKVRGDESEVDPVHTPAWGQALKGDLDNIVLLALRKEPHRRYPSIDALIEDIDRYLAGYPVKARGDSRWYRVRKFTGRHRWAVSSAIAALFLTISFTIFLILQRQATIQARIQAEAERDQAEQVTNYLTTLFESSDPYGAAPSDLRVRDVLAPAIQSIDSLQNSPLVRSNLMATLGSIMVKLELFDEARPLLQESLDFRMKTLGEQHPDTLKSFLDMGMLHLGEGHYDQGEPWLVRAQAILIEDNADLPALNQTELGLAHIYYHQGTYDQATELYRKVIEREHISPGNDNLLLVQAHRGLAMTHATIGDREAAERHYREGLREAEARLGRDHLAYANVLDELGNLYRSLGRYDEAETAYTEALDLRERQMGPSSNAVAASRNNLGWLYLIKGDYPRSEEYLTEALEIRQTTLAPDSDYLATSLNNLAGLYLVMGNYQAAHPLYQEALHIREKILGREHRLFAATLNNLGYIQVLLEQFGPAEAHLQQSLAIRQKKFGPDHPGVARTRIFLGMMELGQNNPKAAASYYGAAREAIENTLGYLHPDMAAVILGLGNAAKLDHAYDEAELLYEEAHAILSATLGEDHLYAAQNRMQLADLRVKQGAFAEASSILQDALKNIKTSVPYDNPHGAETLFFLARVHAFQGEPELALPLCRQALQVQERLLGPDHCKVWESRQLYEQLGGKALDFEEPLVRH